MPDQSILCLPLRQVRVLRTVTVDVTQYREGEVIRAYGKLLTTILRTRMGELVPVIGA